MATLLRESIGVLTEPLVLALLLGLIGGLCLRAGRARTARVLLICAGALAYLASIPFIGQALLRPFEGDFPPLRAGPPPSG